MMTGVRPERTALRLFVLEMRRALATLGQVLLIAAIWIAMLFAVHLRNTWHGFLWK